MSSFDLTQYPLWTALITPMTSNGKVDYPALAHLVERQQHADNGILLLGSTGEGLALTSDEQQNIVQYVVSLKPQVPLMVAVGGFDLPQQLNWIEFLNGQAVDAYLLASPIYAKPGRKGQTLWFGDLLAKAQRPCMIYNVPSRTGVDLDPAALAPLSDHKQFWAIKEASGNLQKFHAFRQTCPNIAVFGGDDGLFASHAADGAAGLVSVCANAWPKATRAYVEHHLAISGGISAREWVEALDSLATAPNPVAIKVLMHATNVIDTPVLRSPLTHLEIESSAHLKTADETIQRWLIGHQSYASNTPVYTSTPPLEEISQ